MHFLIIKIHVFLSFYADQLHKFLILTLLIKIKIVINKKNVKNFFLINFLFLYQLS